MTPESTSVGRTSTISRLPRRDRGKTVGIHKPHANAFGGEFGLFSARENVDPHAECGLCVSNEGFTVRCFAYRCRCENAQVLHLENARDGPKAAEGLQRLLDRVVAEPVRRRNRFAETAQHLLVEDRRRSPYRPFVDDKTH